MFISRTEIVSKPLFIPSSSIVEKGEYCTKLAPLILASPYMPSVSRIAKAELEAILYSFFATEPRFTEENFVLTVPLLSRISPETNVWESFVRGASTTMVPDSKRPFYWKVYLSPIGSGDHSLLILLTLICAALYNLFQKGNYWLYR